MKKVEYNIEYGHIFTDSPRIDSTQKKSIELAKEFTEKLKEKKKDFSLNILIDDYSPNYSYLDISEYLEEFQKSEVSPDYIVYETGLLEIAKKILKSEIPKEMILDEIEEKEIKGDKEILMLENPQTDSVSLVEEDFLKRPTYIHTPLLIAAWFLIRLGLIHPKRLARKINFKGSKSFAGKKIMTIMPSKWKEIDNKAKDIISATKYKDSLKDMEFIYF
ncbi:MAG: hypothetical protein KKF48_01090 [Nanoarchaeota archaeon]|nr:hypothetical protein [Nanoarchaeota archaeon]MBU1027618.1 hypothetical protein [Nanoarchaeota archaeon]